MYDRAHSIWDNIKDNVWGDYVEVSAKCFLGYDYPELHPLQGEDREELWGAICDGRERDLFTIQETVAKYGKLYWVYASVCFPCHTEKGFSRRISNNKGQVIWKRNFKDK